MANNPSFDWWEINPNGSAVTIAIPSGLPLFDLRVTLTGVQYVLKFDWHDREQRYYMSVSDVDGNLITAGIKLLSSWGLYQRETQPGAPHGNFVIADPDNLPPALADFGQRTKLIFWPKP